MSTTSTPVISWIRVTRFALIATISNLVIFGIGSFAGSAWLAGGLTIAWFMIIGASVVPLFVGAGVTALLGLGWKNAAKVMAWVGLVFAVVTVPSPFLATPEIGTAIALASMHIVVGIAWFLSLRRRA